MSAEGMTADPATTDARSAPATDAVAPRRRLVELSHVIEAGMVTLPPLPGPEITTHLSREASQASYAPGTTFEIGRISMVANTGTYVDSPYHRFAEGADLAQVGLDRLAELPAVVVSVTGSERLDITPEELSGHDVRRLTLRYPGVRARRCLPESRRSRVARRARSGTGRHRRRQHRRHGRPHKARAHDPARSRHPCRGTPDGTRAAACDRLGVQCCTAARPGIRNVPCTCIRVSAGLTARRLDGGADPLRWGRWTTSPSPRNGA
jgi:Putative cyclase